MRFVGLEDAFAKYKAKLKNPMWAVSAIADDGSLVVSCWAHLFGGGGKDVMRYTDTLSRWGNNSPGNNLLREHLIAAHSQQLPVRLVIATAANESELAGVTDASKVKKTFHVKENVVGKVIDFDGDAFVMEFRKAV
jgi:hypothetical protein